MPDKKEALSFQKPVSGTYCVYGNILLLREILDRVKPGSYFKLINECEEIWELALTGMTENLPASTRNMLVWMTYNTIYRHTIKHYLI